MSVQSECRIKWKLYREKHSQGIYQNEKKKQNSNGVSHLAARHPHLRVLWPRRGHDAHSWWRRCTKLRPHLPCSPDTPRSSASTDHRSLRSHKLDRAATLWRRNAFSVQCSVKGVSPVIVKSAGINKSNTKLFEVVKHLLEESSILVFSDHISQLCLLAIAGFQTLL